MNELVPEQAYGRDWLAGRTEALLADIMGYGKSAQALTAATKLGAERVVVVCPAVARLNWEREAAKWGMDLPVVRVTDKSDHLLPAKPGRMLAIVGYDGVAKSGKLRGALNSSPWDVVICDEAHRLKSPESNRTKALYGQRIDGKRCLMDKALYRWLLTASPMPNGAAELWPHLSALWPQLISDPYSGRVLDDMAFLQRYCVFEKTLYSNRVVGYKDREGLVALLDSIMLRRTEIVGLPDLVLREDPYLVEVDDARLAELESHEEFQDLLAILNSVDAREKDLDAIEDDFIHLATLRRLTGILKARPVAQVVASELEAGDKVVLFAVHREVIAELENVLTLAGIKCAIVHGGVPDGMRNTEIDRFNNDPECTAFIGQIEACKECINLPAANRVRLVEQSWCPETNAQAIARVHRRGNLRQVFADTFAIANSIDETVQRVLTQKTRNIRELMKESYNG